MWFLFWTTVRAWLTNQVKFLRNIKVSQYNKYTDAQYTHGTNQGKAQMYAVLDGHYRLFHDMNWYCNDRF